MYVDCDISNAIDLMSTLLRKTPYATNNALSRTAKEVVAQERTMVADDLMARKKFILNRVKITRYPKPNSLVAEVGIDARVQGGKLLLPEFEQGGEKKPEHGDELAVALTGKAARPDFRQNIPRSMLYKALEMQASHTKAGKIQYKGRKRTYVVPGVGVFMRTGPKQEDTIMIYKFKREVELKKRISFVETARRVVFARFQDIWDEEFVKELRGRAKYK